MTDEELGVLVDEMYEHFGTLPSLEHEPKRFKMAVKMFKYYKEQASEKVQTLHDFTDGS